MAITPFSITQVFANKAFRTWLAAPGSLGKQGIQMIYTTVHQVLAQGNYVLAVSEGYFGGAPTSYYDLWRIENGKIAEHWDVMETSADKSTWQNQNSKF